MRYEFRLLIDPSEADLNRHGAEGFHIVAVSQMTIPSVIGEPESVSDAVYMQREIIAESDFRRFESAVFGKDGAE